MKEKVQEIRDILTLLNTKVRHLSKEEGATLEFTICQDKKEVSILATPDNQNNVLFTMTLAKVTVNTEL
jgi:hypothetical protein